MLRVGIIRCQQTEEWCGGTTDFKVAKDGKGAFEAIGPVEVVGFVSCGGCCGKRAINRAKMLVEKGAEAIAFASCIAKGSPIGFSCPHYEKIKEAIVRKLGPDIKIFEHTH